MLPIRPWLDPPLAALRYVMCFRYCGERHVLYHGASGPESSRALCLEEVRPVAVPVGLQKKIECLVELFLLQVILLITCNEICASEINVNYSFLHINFFFK